MQHVLDVGCKVCHMPRALSGNGLCDRCESLADIIREKYANKRSDPGPKPRGRRPHCPSCRKTCVLDVDDFSGEWAFFCPGPCIDYCWKCSVYYPDDQFCPKCGS